jgi:hypothetical protein
MGITARRRSTTALRSTTQLPPHEVLGIVKIAAVEVNEGGKPSHAAGIIDAGVRLNVVRESDTGLLMSVTSGRKWVELCTFSAKVNVIDDGRTRVQIGGLETYTTQQRRILIFLPAGPKQIGGMDPYKRFLRSVAGKVRDADPTASVVVAAGGMMSTATGLVIGVLVVALVAVRSAHGGTGHRADVAS